MPPNFPALREMALLRLRTEGSRPFTDPEAHTVGTLLGRRLANDMESPLLQSASYDLDYLGLGPAEFILSWLSPQHAAVITIPDTMADIALRLLQQPSGHSRKSTLPP